MLAVVAAAPTDGWGEQQPPTTPHAQHRKVAKQYNITTTRSTETPACQTLRRWLFAAQSFVFTLVRSSVVRPLAHSFVRPSMVGRAVGCLVSFIGVVGFEVLSCKQGMSRACAGAKQ